MIKKQYFIDTISFIKEKREREKDLFRALTDCGDNDDINAFIYNEYEFRVVKMLKALMGISNDNFELERWIWVCDYGTKYNDKVELSSPDKFYDYLVSISKRTEILSKLRGHCDNEELIKELEAII